LSGIKDEDILTDGFWVILKCPSKAEPLLQKYRIV